MRECPRKQSSWASQVQDEDNLGWNDHDLEIGYLTLTATTEQSNVSQVRDQLKVMTLDEKSELANQLGLFVTCAPSSSSIYHHSKRAVLCIVMPYTIQRYLCVTNGLYCDTGMEQRPLWPS
jgi:hypothetical protein